MKDEHNKAMTAAMLSAVQAKIDEVKGILAPFIISLTPEERRERLKLGDKTLAFAEKSFAYAQANPALVPSYLEMEMFSIDMKDATGLRTLEISIQQLATGISDTIMVAGGEAYNESLIFYNAVKQAAKQNIPGAKAVYEDLQKRFPGRPSTKKEEE